VPYTGGEVCLYAFADTHVVVDSFGWSGTGGGLVLASPSRLLDTRSGVGSSGGPASPSNVVQLRVAGRGGVPNDVAAAFITVTATGGTAAGFVTAYPCDQPRPVASVLNLRSGLLRSNLALVDLSVADGRVCLYAYTVDGSPVHLVADAVGWLPGTVSRPHPPPETNPPAPPPSGSEHFSTLPPGSTLPSDADCAARVRPAAEIRPQITSYNQTRGHGAPANPPAPLYARVTGNFTGTTDEILQWAACKWGIDEDLVRAQAAKESYWTMANVGDNGESFGIMQVRQPYWGWAFNNGVGDAMSSTAYNVDAALAARRNCFEGNETWLGGNYGAGDLWGCVGLWFSGQWHDPGAEQYITDVQTHLNQRIWEDPGFIAYRG
jgi:autotransporter family porin